MSGPDSIGELDLLAYADGRLDGDGERKRLVEAHLAEDPEAAALVADVKAQNAAIRRLYGFRAAEPPPARLLAALERSSGRRRSRALEAACLGLLLLGAGTAGWLFGKEGGGEGRVAGAFIELAAEHHRQVAAAVASHDLVADAGLLQPLAWLEQRMALEVKAPDLEPQGLHLIAKEQVGPLDNPAVQLSYRRSDGALLNLFVRPRWEEARTRVERRESNGVTVLHWAEGPLAFALTADDAGAGLARIAEVVEAAMGHARLREEPPPTVVTEGAEAPPVTTVLERVGPIVPGTGLAPLPINAN